MTAVSAPSPAGCYDRLIPLPQVRETGGDPLDLSASGAFRLTDHSAPLVRIGAALTRAGWREESDAPLAISRVDDGGAGAPESFTLAIDARRIQVRAAGRAGQHAAAGAIEQLIALADGPCPAAELSDAPAYRWRGVSVDIARSFFGPQTLRRVADLAATYRFNRLHLHLTDDQGWRLQLACRPALTRISGGHAATGGQSGFLTPHEFREFDAYCAARGLILVPEIDVPGHTNAALHALPELNPDGRAPEPYAGEDVGFSRLHLARPETEAFLRDVFGEVAALTSGPYVHVGGDEATVLDSDEYVDLVTMALAAVRSTGKIPVGWQEIAPAVTGPGVLLQYWDSGKPADLVVAAAARGARVILAPGNRTYLDMVSHLGDDGQDWAGAVPLDRVLDWRPAAELTAAGLPPEAIEGVEAAIWTEFIHTESRLFSMLLPRLAGVAEVAWAGAARGGAANLRERIGGHRPLWQAMDLPLDFPPHAWS